MVKIRLKRFGSKKKPVYRIVVIDSRNRRDGRPIEEIGFYDPRKEAADGGVQLNKESYDNWVKQGAQPTDVVERLVKKQAQEAQVS